MIHDLLYYRKGMTKPDTTLESQKQCILQQLQQKWEKIYYKEKTNWKILTTLFHAIENKCLRKME